MAWRYRKRVKIAPGIYLNASSSGLGLSVGPRGSSISFSSRGTYANTSFMGFSNRQRIGGGRRSGPTQKEIRLQEKLSQQQRLASDLQYLVDNPPQLCVDGEEGPVVLRTQGGMDLEERFSALAWKYAREDIIKTLTKTLDEQKRRIEDLGTLHLRIPNPGSST